VFVWCYAKERGGVEKRMEVRYSRILICRGYDCLLYLTKVWQKKKCVLLNSTRLVCAYPLQEDADHARSEQTEQGRDGRLMAGPTFHL
jgi:hypothetical protein